MNNMLRVLKELNNYKQTENGGVALRSTLSDVYDMFAFGGAYRQRSDEDCILLFKNAFEENPELALRCLFYLRDARGGQGERRFFRVCFSWLVKNYPEIAIKNLGNVPFFGRWDDLIYSALGYNKDVDETIFAVIAGQLALDLECKTPSLLAKWLPSENASSRHTQAMGNVIRTHLGLTHKEYRKILSELRSRINIVEKLMSENRWDEIEFDKIPSKAGLIYKNAFARRDIIKRKYEAFAKDENSKVNAKTLYPYEIVAKARYANNSSVDHAMIEKYWNNLPDYFDGKQSNMLCVVDTSGSMTWNGNGNVAPIDVAISLGMYAASKAGGPFKNHYISFSRYPKLVEIKGIDFVDAVRRIYRTNLCENTDLTKTFDLLLAIADLPSTKETDIPETIVVISDMEIDAMSHGGDWGIHAETEMEKMREKWAAHGHKLPRLVYWNVNARNNTILDRGDSVSFVSGMSPSIFESIITGKNGIDLMLETLMKDRYDVVVCC